jgi:uncharacterized membrane-anchored protein
VPGTRFMGYLRDKRARTRPDSFLEHNLTLTTPSTLSVLSTSAATTVAAVGSNAHDDDSVGGRSRVGRMANVESGSRELARRTKSSASALARSIAHADIECNSVVRPHVFP